LGHAKSKNLSIELQTDGLPLLVFADRVRLRQVLLNLSSNAIKFTRQGGVMVRATQTDGRVRIEVQDTGVGIKPEDLQLVFEKFRQTEAFVTRSQQGTGLGLTLAKELVQRMAGQIGVTSAHGEGSTFYVDLPAANNTNIA
jgi:signal transduction histidine kinase